MKCPKCGHEFKPRNTIQSKGGKARAKAITPERASAIGRKAARARWKKH